MFAYRRKPDLMLRRTLLLFLALLVLVPLAHAQKIIPSAIRLEGNDRVDGARVRAVLSISPGRELSLEEIDRDLQAIVKLGYFDDVRVDLRDEGQGQVLVFIVHERPLIREVRFAGNKKLSEEKLRPLVTLRVPGIQDPVQVRQSVAAIRHLYQEEGYHAVRIDAQLKTDERNESLLTFKIDEGKKVLIDEIAFEGNKVFSGKELRETMRTKERWIFSWMTGRGTYKAEEIQFDLDAIKALYFDHGYMDVRIKQPLISLVDDNEYMKLLIEVEEGAQYKVGEIRIAGDLIKPRQELEKLLKLKSGMDFSRTALQQSILDLTDLYADQGYANVNVVPFTDKDRDELTIDLKLMIEQGELVHIEKILIRGNTKTRDKVIRRELTLVEGDLYSQTKIKQSRGRLHNLGFFEEVNLSTRPGSEKGQDELTVEISEKPTGSFTVGAGYSSVDQFIFQGSIAQANFLGYGIKLDASATLGGSSELYRLGVTDPYFLDTRWTAGFDLYKTERDWTDFSEKATGGALKVGHPLGSNIRGLLTYRYEEKEIFDIDKSTVTSLSVLDQEGTSILSSLTGSLSRNTTDYRFDPTRGSVSNFTAEFAGLGGSEHFAKFELSHRHFLPLFWKAVLSVHGDIGYITKTTDEPIPVSEKFFLGGLRSIRGFETREVGPKEGETFIGGEKAAFFNVELLFPINEKYKLKGLFFFDTGNAWLESEEYFKNMRYSAGYGIRWLSPLGPLRFEWGYNLDPLPGEKNNVFEFSVGTFF